MELLYVTTNTGKLLSLQRDMEPYGIQVVQIKMELQEPRSSDVEEIAKGKATTACRQLHKPVAVSDAGFYIHSLNGFPRAFVNFTLETIDLEGILTLLTGKDRQCEFRECLAYMDGDLTEPVCFTANVRGTLATEIRGEIQEHFWSRLALIFIPNGGAKTIAEMTPIEYTAWRKISREKESSSSLFTNWFVTNRLQ